MSNFSSYRIERMLKLIKTSLVPEKYNDAYIKKIIDHYINKAQKESQDMNFNGDTIGFESDINKSFQEITDLNEVCELTISNNPIWFGFIPKDKKIVYSFEIVNNISTNSGYYYYMNDYSYLYEFAKYIKDKEISDDVNFISHVHNFIHKYFSSFSRSIDRERLHHLIYDTNGKFHKPVKEHNISDFKGNGSAMCSEYSALVQNILSVFGYQTAYIHGEIDNDTEKNCCHAYNLAVIDNSYTIIDSSIPMNCYDVNNNKSKFPFVFCMYDFDENNLEQFLSGDVEIELDDLDAYTINNNYYTFSNNKKRVYRAEYDFFS